MNVRSQFVAVAFALTLGFMSCSTAESDPNDSPAATQTETDSPEEGIQGTYVIQGPEVYSSLFIELKENFGFKNIGDILLLNDLMEGGLKGKPRPNTHVAGRVLQIPPGIDVPEPPGIEVPE